MEERHLQASVSSEGGAVHVSPRGAEVNFSNEYCKGSTFFAHRPQLGSGIPFAHDGLLTKLGAGTNLTFELQIQFCCQAPPRGPLWLIGELREAPMKLGLVTRSLCRVLLGLIKTQVAKRGMDFRYSFGDAEMHPHIALPLFAADRILFSNGPVPLPADVGYGAWQMGDEKVVPVDKTAVRLDAGTYVTVMFCTAFLDFESWRAVNIPGVGSLDLSQFWGSQPLSIAIFDELAPASTDRHMFFELELASVLGQIEPAAALTRAPEFRISLAPADEVKDSVVDLVDVAVDEAEELEEAPSLDPQSPYTAPEEPWPEGQGESSDEEFWDAIEEHSHPKAELSRQVSELSWKSVHLERQLDQQGRISLDDGSVHERGSVSVPWYFCSGAGDLWWCIDYSGRACWRPQNQLQGLCLALGGRLPPVSAKSPLRDLEHARRVATALLTQGCSAPGLLEEFASMDLNLGSILSGLALANGQAIFAAVVETEGRLVERCVWRKGEALEWVVRGTKRSRNLIKVHVNLKSTSLSATSIAGAEAVKLSTPQRGFVFVVKNHDHRDMLRRVFQVSVTANGAENKLFGYLGGSIFRSVADVAARVPGACWIRGDPPRQTAPWKDMLRRWPVNRIVINDTEPFLGCPPMDPMMFSAELLRSAVAASSVGHQRLELVNELTIRSGGLKCISLETLSQQDLWGFWVNVYHCLLVHAQLVAGQPRGLQQVVGFHNNSSYLVAGHVFSLVEIEHCILRRHMTKPKIHFVKHILKIWRRTDQDLESRPCLATSVCSASCFACRPDWRLNLVLNAGNHGSADKIPVFESVSEESFDMAVHHAMERTIVCCGCVSQTAIELPFNLSRYKDDAPLMAPDEASERGWARALAPDSVTTVKKITYSRNYGWSMRERLEVLPYPE